MEKVKLPREVGEAIKHLKTHHGGNETILAGILGNANGSCIVTLREYANENGFDILLQALVNGYEVEETPEDKVRKLFNTITPEGWKFNNNPQDSIYQQRDVIRTVLGLLNIKIEGVNA